MARNNDKTKVYHMLEVMDVVGTPLKGLQIAITGHLAHPRKKIEELIQQAGGFVSPRVSYGTSFLVSNEDWTANTVDRKSSKQKAAERCGVRVIREDELLAMLIQD